jgi:hypothetical protein
VQALLDDSFSMWLVDDSPSSAGPSIDNENVDTWPDEVRRISADRSTRPRHTGPSRRCSEWRRTQHSDQTVDVLFMLVGVQLWSQPQGSRHDGLSTSRLRLPSSFCHGVDYAAHRSSLRRYRARAHRDRRDGVRAPPIPLRFGPELSSKVNRPDGDPEIEVNQPQSIEPRLEARINQGRYHQHLVDCTPIS